MQDQDSAAQDRLDELGIGQTDTVLRTITAEDVAAFARLSGDYNALHLDDEFAARTEFSSRVVHGFLHASLLSTLIGMRLPGRGALYLSQSIVFSAPVYVGDTVEARGTITAISRDSRVVDLDTEIRNQHGTVVLRGKAQAKVLRLPKTPARRAGMNSAAPGTAKLLAGRTALVTGASRGIGRATARLLAEQGAHVWINYHNSHSAADAICNEIRLAGGTCDVVRADVSREGEVGEMLRRISDAGGIDVLVNNAGPKITAKPFEQASWEEMAHAYTQIVGSAFLVTQAALPSLKKSGGAIVNVLSSACLQRTSHHWLAYVSAKSALQAMSKNLAQELGPVGITVNMVSPSLTDTDLVAGTPDRLRQMIIGRTPLRRLATVDDVAGAILLLVSPYARFVTGENLLVTGGDVMI
ncbi:MAG: dehydratase [Alphaproteobacteria bacterium BRH_c36]|nr:MAG: dehydratase [Alphaproteobacteria bacterium BRH_c36]